MNRKNFNEVLKKRELEEKNRTDNNGEMTLDSTERVKVLSPGRLVFNRFIRNKLAIVGSVILIIMFLFSFLMPVFYPYSQTEIFYKYDKVVTDYAVATQRTDYSNIKINEDIDITLIKAKLGSTINSMKSEGITETSLTDDDGNSFLITENEDRLYTLRGFEMTEIASYSGYTQFAKYNSIFKDLEYIGEATADEGFATQLQQAIDSDKDEFSYQGQNYRIIADKKNSYIIEQSSSALSYTGTALGEDFEAALSEEMEAGSFTFGGNDYVISTDNAGGYKVYQTGEQTEIGYLTTYVFDAYESGVEFDNSFKIAVLSAIAAGNQSFSYEGTDYTLLYNEDEWQLYEKSNTKTPVAVLSDIVVRSNSGEDNLGFAFKERAREIIAEMKISNSVSSSFDWDILQLNSDGEYMTDENGDYIKEPTEVSIKFKSGSYVMTCEQVTYLIDIFADPSPDHLIGTDGDGMDVLARMMYGGRVSLLVCFIVIIIETVIGVILGGIAGFFGGWIDNVIMRLVDIFYCIPSLPILIILGALFDSMKMEPYIRLAWMMVVLGLLGWASVARLVRGQILSLREQEFMVACEAIGLKSKRRIFRHLLPNVMPQLIVNATSGLGSIIITESTLSFLGLGVKHPLATWGTMINSVTSSSEAMIKYSYIWVPVGILICLTVVAFNFVGDGLRDAFDPKMKR